MERQQLAVTAVLVLHLPYLVHPLLMPVAVVVVYLLAVLLVLAAQVVAAMVRLCQQLWVQMETQIQVVEPVEVVRLALQILAGQVAQAAQVS
jgi:uncharacterized metal-binding protein